MDFLRQRDIINERDIMLQPIFIVGAGSIGSYTTLALTKMGAGNVKVMDHDNVEAHNIPNQFYTLDDVGDPKVDALYRNILANTGCLINKTKGKFSADGTGWFGNSIVIAAVDNMETRNELYKSILKNKHVKTYIDARMAMLSIEVFSINPEAKEDREIYEEKLFPDSEAVGVPCTARGIIYPVMTCASLICNVVKKVVGGEQYARRYVIDYTKDFFFAEERSR